MMVDYAAELRGYTPYARRNSQISEKKSNLIEKKMLLCASTSRERELGLVS